MTTENTEKEYVAGPKAETGKPLVHVAPGTLPVEEYIAGPKADTGKPLVHTAPVADETAAQKAIEAEEDALYVKINNAHKRAMVAKDAASIATEDPKPSAE
jgi:hypothetical protein